MVEDGAMVKDGAAVTTAASTTVEDGAAVTTAAMSASGAIAERRYRVQKDYRGVLPQACASSAPGKGVPPAHCWQHVG